jgi:Ca2+-transporting ATPase
VELIKGAPEVVLGSAPDPTADAVLAGWTHRAFRVLAVAADIGSGPTLLGLLAMADPVREDARDAVDAARRAGIRVVMVTGDHLATAEAVARAVDIDTCESAVESDDGELRSVYARTDPAGKLAIVTAWQRAGAVVAMTGDGVNDAPALRAADVGVAMGRRGTDVAREAADLVVTDDSLGTIITAVGEGRRVYDNLLRFLRFGLSGGLAEILVMLLGPFLGLPLPLLPGQILWVNLITHGLPGVAMGAEEAESDVLTRPPRPPQEGILTRRATVEVLVLGGLLTICCLGLAIAADGAGMSWQTMIFATLTLGQLGIALVTRSSWRPVWRMSPAGNPFLYWAVAASAALLAAAIYLPVLSELLGTVPLTVSELGSAVAVGAIPGLLVEFIKLGRRRRSLAV